MNILIVHAHENPSSFSSALASTARTYFERNGASVTVSDLYKQQFNPVGGKHDFKKQSNAEYYKYALEQFHAHNETSFASEIKREMDALTKADVLIFNFPLWWFDMPAILKGWVDRVLAYGFAYGGDYGLYKKGRFKNKRAFLSITTGSPESFYNLKGMHQRTLSDILRNIHEGILGLVGFDVQEPFVAYAVSRSSAQERKEILKKYSSYLHHHFGESYITE